MGLSVEHPPVIVNGTKDPDALLVIGGAGRRWARAVFKACSNRLFTSWTSEKNLGYG